MNMPRSCSAALRRRSTADGWGFFVSSRIRATLAAMRDVLSAETVREVERLAVAHGACNLRVLDSVRTDDIGRVVFLVDLDEGRSLFDLVALTDELRATLGVVVNVLTERSISPYLRDSVLAEAKPL